MVFRIFNRKVDPKAEGPKDPNKKGKERRKKKSKGKKKSKKSEKDDGSDDGTNSTSMSTDASNTALEDVMKDNLDVMREIIMRIREDEDYAKTIYADCPRLQHLLDQNPDLRPIFEDPNMVRINFEHVYRKCGGVLPEDRPSWIMRTLACIVKHPLFKIFRVLLFIKKCYSCIFNGGLLMIRNFFVGLFTGDFSGPELPDAEDLLEDAGNPENVATREALMKAAEHFEEPEVQSQIDFMLENDPEDLDEMIEQDPDLKALRETNPLCSELMGDPATLKIMVDPDNLRALAECPDLIEADFADPNWSPPDVESIPFDDPAYAEADRAMSMSVPELDVEPDIEPDNADAEAEEGEEDDDEEEEEEGFLEEFERGEETEANAAGKKGGQQKKQQNNKKKDGQGGFLSTIGTGLVDYIAAETVGVTASEMMGGDDFGVDELEDQLEEVADEAEEMADDVENAVGQAEQFVNTVGAVGEMAGGEDLAENVEGAMDEAEDTHDDKLKDSQNLTEEAVGAGALGAVAGMGMVGGNEGDKDKAKTLGDEDDDEPEDKKKGRFGRLGAAIGGGFGALGAAAKEFAITAVIGEDLAEEVLDQMEDDDDESSSKSEDDDGANTEKRKEEKGEPGSQSSLFRRRNR